MVGNSPVNKLWTYSIVLMLASFCGCSATHTGPDKQFSGTVQGAAIGAGAGAITGAHLSAATGPGVAVGAGLGAVAGGIRGFVIDETEEQLLEFAARTQEQREIANAHELLQEHFKRRQELHPTRDLYPADWFFAGDEVRLRPSAYTLVRELVRLNKERMPWSRLVIAAYVQARDGESEYAAYLARERSNELGDAFIKAGIEARRITTRAVIVEVPTLIDPYDRPDRYSQAIEIIPLDR